MLNDRRDRQPKQLDPALDENASMPWLAHRVRARVSRTRTRASVEGLIRGCVDEPEGANLRRGEHTAFCGWALDGLRPPSAVEILVSRQRGGPAQLGLRRPDVPVNLGEPGASSECGWAGSVDLIGWPDPDVHVQIVVTGQGGTKATLMDYVFRVRDDENAESKAATRLDLSALDQALEVLREAGWASSQMSAASSKRTHPFSESLEGFNREAPYVRDGIASFVAEVAQTIPRGARVVDVGAGDAPYRELFHHADYVTIDWEHSIHEGARHSDIHASADNLPLHDRSVDAVLMTEVLEHISTPDRALAEVARVLRPGGSLVLTVPFVWILHEMPNDFYRYTPSALRMLLEIAGFADIEISNRGDYFTTLAQLMQIVPSWLMEGSNADGLDGRRRTAANALAGVARAVSALSPLDNGALLPLGFNVTARRMPTAPE